MKTIHDIVFGEAKPDRACGTCVACCKVLNINEPDLFKPADQLCMHCNGKGCGIYDSRPAICRTWNCAWRRIASMPIETRPDKLGVVFTLDRQANPQSLFDRLYVVGRAVDDAKALYSPETGNVAVMLAQGPLPIYLCAGEHRQLIYPREDLAAAIVNPFGPFDAALVAEGRAWAAKYEPFARLADAAAGVPVGAAG